jgi:carbonic anhydrase
MASGEFATAINCIDGRAQQPVADWLKLNQHVRYVDAITEPGVDKVLAEGSPEQIEAIRRKVLISVNAHGSRAIAVAGHHDCAGNPVSKEEHLEHIRQSVETIAAWGLPVQVIGLWVNELFWIEEVCAVDGRRIDG